MQKTQKNLLAELKIKRAIIAMGNGVPAHMIFRDEVLIEMSERMPSSEFAMQQIFGVGPTKYKMYGDHFLAVIQRYKQTHKAS